ncbi:hypothetical protein COBT_001438 [Conglomerata obtusa]
MSVITNIDMASAMEAIQIFSGGETEDITSWIKQILLVQVLSQLDDEIMLRVAALKLRSTAQKWCCDLLATKPTLTLAEFLENCSQRFNNPQHAHGLLEKFLMTGTATTKEEFRELLATATKLLEKGYLTSKTMIKLLISRAPPELKIVLLQASLHANESWQHFIKVAEENSWIAYPDHHMHTISTSAIQSKTIQK